MTTYTAASLSDAARRALDYLCLIQIYLKRNLLLAEPLRLADVAEIPSGHWGVCPPVNAVLAALGTIDSPALDRMVIHGAGHAGPSARAHAWLTKALQTVAPEYSWDYEGLRLLVEGFRNRDCFGAEITALIPGQFYMGGQLGPALATAHGMALDAPDRLVVTLIGDGEAETGATAAAWLGAHALRKTGRHGRVLPVLLLNGLRMGGRSLLGMLGAEQLARWLAALGYEPIVTADNSTGAVRDALVRGLERAGPLEEGPATAVIVTVPKGFGAPSGLMGTASLHKTPLRDPRHDADELTQLSHWLEAYRPRELFNSDGSPSGLVVAGLHSATADSLANPKAPPVGSIVSAVAQARAARLVSTDFGLTMTATLEALRDSWAIRVFSPDELTSNRLSLEESTGKHSTWVVEILNEELCQAWAQGYAEAGGRSVIVTYEAFAPIVTSLLAQHLIHRRLAATAGRPTIPSITYLLTSLGWHNTVSHGNPGLIDSVLAIEDPAVHVYAPADPARAAAALTVAVQETGRCSFILASKHPVINHPLETLIREVTDGYAIWPHVSDTGVPDLVLLSAGDIAATELSKAATTLRTSAPHLRLRYVHVHDLTCLGNPDRWPLGMSRTTFDEVFPPTTPVLAAVNFHAAAAHALLHARQQARRVLVRGWVPVANALSPAELLKHARIDSASLTIAALDLVQDSHKLIARREQDVHK